MMGHKQNILTGTCEGKLSPGRSGRRWKDETKMNFKKNCFFKIVYWIVLFLDRGQWWVNNPLRPKIYPYNENQQDALFLKCI